METCHPQEAGLDEVWLEKHRLRSRWQSSLGILPGLAECVLSGDRVAYLDVVGAADVEYKTRMRSSTLFRCFSMTKPITAVALMRLVESRQLGLDDPVSKYIPSFRTLRVVKPEYENDWDVNASHPQKLEPVRVSMTVRHLLTHTSGLAYGPGRCCLTDQLKAESAAEASYLGLTELADSGAIGSLAKFCDALAQLPLRFQPGSQYLYSQGVDVAGRIIEIVSGQPIDAFLREAVLGPLGMAETTFRVEPEAAKGLSAMYLVEKEERSEFCPYLRRIDGEAPDDSRWCRNSAEFLAGGGVAGSCSGGLVSCLKDISSFVRMLASGGLTSSGAQLLRRSTVRALWRDWLTLRSVVGSGHNKQWRIPGWAWGNAVGWSPLGHVRRRDGCLFMGGWSTSWAIYPMWRLAVISLAPTVVYFDIPGWKTSLDELDSTVERSAAIFRRREQPAATSRKKGSTKLKFLLPCSSTFAKGQVCQRRRLAKGRPTVKTSITKTLNGNIKRPNIDRKA